MDLLQGEFCTSTSSASTISVSSQATTHPETRLAQLKFSVSQTADYCALGLFRWGMVIQSMIFQRNNNHHSHHSSLVLVGKGQDTIDMGCTSPCALAPTEIMRLKLPEKQVSVREIPTMYSRRVEADSSAQPRTRSYRGPTSTARCPQLSAREHIKKNHRRPVAYPACPNCKSRYDFTMRLGGAPGHQGSKGPPCRLCFSASAAPVLLFLLGDQPGASPT